MSLSLTELNYLVWRYLQELGYDLAAYALDKHLECSRAVERDDNPLVAKVFPGALVDLVQKGILYTMTEEEVAGKPELLTLFGSLSLTPQDPQLPLKLEETAHTNGTADTAMELDTWLNTTNGEAFVTADLEPVLEFTASISFAWHPLLLIFAFGENQPQAVISVLNGLHLAVVELVTLTHPAQAGGGANLVNLVSWLPLGTLLVTACASGELRLWSPDGKLKNLAPLGPAADLRAPPIAVALEWLDLGQFLLLVDTHHQVSLWDANLNLIKLIRTGEATKDDKQATVCVSWLSEHKFCVTTRKFLLKVYNISNNLDVQPIGNLHGHSHPILKISRSLNSKYLATVSDYDYIIKIWTAGVLQECLDLNTPQTAGKHLHTSPIIGMFWLEPQASELLLLTVLMDAVLNLWNTHLGDNYISSQLYKDGELFSDGEAIKTPAVIFNADLSPDGQLLALADDYGRVTIWELRLPSRKVVCVGKYTIEIPHGSHKVGVCDLKWSRDLKQLGVSYLGHPSVLLQV